MSTTTGKSIVECTVSLVIVELILHRHLVAAIASEVSYCYSKDDLPAQMHQRI